MQELADELARAGHSATPVGGKLVIAGGILRSGARTMDALVVDPARLSISRCAARQHQSRGGSYQTVVTLLQLGCCWQMTSRRNQLMQWLALAPLWSHFTVLMQGSQHVLCRPKEQGVAPETCFRHTAIVAPLQRGTPLHDAAAAQLGDLGVAAAPESGTLILLWGGYNTLNAEFGGPDIQVPFVLLAPLLSTIAVLPW